MDAITKAFNLMNERGLIARENYECCQSCGGYAITVEAEKMIDEGKPKDEIKGCCFYHEQDMDNRCDGGEFYLAYGLMESGKHGYIGLSNEEVGRIVTACLTEVGVEFEWDGDGGTRIKVLDDNPPERTNYDCMWCNDEGCEECRPEDYFDCVACHDEGCVECQDEDEED